MQNKIPNTPFATRLSGSTKEIQLRIRSIFQWKKKRFPVWLFTLTVVVIFGCIGLVSCRPEQDNEWWGLNAKVVEIDAEQMILYIQDMDEDANVFGQRCALDCKQAAQEDRLIFVDYETNELTNISIYEFQVGDEIIIEMYTSQKEGAKDAAARAEQVQLGTQRPLYVTLIQTANWYGEFIENCWNNGSGYQYAGFTEFAEDDRTLMVQDIPENLVEELLFSNYYFSTVFEFEGLLGIQGSDNLRLSAENERKNAADGLYFENVIIHNFATLSREDFTPGGFYFTDAEMSFKFVDQANYLKEEHGLTEYAVVYVDLSWKWSEKALELGPQLDDGRYERLYLVGKTSEDANWKLYECFWGEHVLNRTLEPENIDDSLEVQLAHLGLDEYEYPVDTKVTTLVHQTIGSRTLMLIEVEGGFHIAGLNNLVMGVYDEDTKNFVGDTFDIHGDEPGYTSWRGTDGCLYVLWTNTIYYQGNGTSNGLGYFRFDGQTLEPLYDLPVPARNCGILPNLPETEAILCPVSENSDSYDFWFSRKAWPIDHGIDLYEKNPDWDGTRPGEGEQWIYIGFVPFAITDDTVTEKAKELILDYIETTWPLYRTYYLGEGPGTPQLGDERIDGVFYAGEEQTDETMGVAFRVERSSYNDWGSLYLEPCWMKNQSCIYVILGRDQTGEFYEVRGYDTPNSEKSINQSILEVSYDLIDLEVSLWRDGHLRPTGPGSEVTFFRDAYDGAAQVEVLEGWEPIYWPGAYWTRQSWNGFSALCYHVGEEPGQPDPDAYSIYMIDTTRTDLQTYRGIRVGATRAEVREAYPVLYDTEYWHTTDPDFPGDDYLWYCVNSDGFGAAILFFFEGDVVSQIRLKYMFN